MIISRDNSQLIKELSKVNRSKSKIGFVPTMGALHEGHLSLIKEAFKLCDYVVVSIFVNPTQFDNSEDLKKYPRTPEKDFALLQKAGVNLVYYPEVKDVYPADSEPFLFDLGVLDKIMEGKFRKNHFMGVAQVVHRFFTLIKPDFAVFGDKDLQQVAVVKKMVATFKLSTRIVTVETKREDSGLAMSSRNERLSAEDKEKALIIHKTLKATKKHAVSSEVENLQQFANNYFEKNNTGLKLEYAEIVDRENFTKPDAKTNKENIYLCIAAWCGNVRLIDNIQLFD